MTITYLFYLILGFLSGSVLYSYLWPKLLCQKDVTALSDDHNPGTFNALRCCGPRVGLLCLLCDVGKGFVPLWFAARALAFDRPLFALVLVAPVCGHAFSPFFHGRGGKAIAVSFGCLLALLPVSRLVVLLAALYLFFSLVVVIQPHRVRTLWVFALFALFGWIIEPVFPLSLGGALIAAVVICKNAPVPEGERAFVSLLGRARGK